MKMTEQVAAHPEDFMKRGAALQNEGARLMAMTASDDRDTGTGFRLHSFWALPGRVVYLYGDLGESSAYPSLTPNMTAAYWYEREIRDLFGLEPVGHPDPRPLVVHDDWPAGVFPMRRDYRGPLPERAALPQPTAWEPGPVGIPVGPVHAGIIEPGHFRFSAVGEQVLALSPRFSFVHRGLEKAAEGQRPDEALRLAERVCGVCTVSHSWSFCQAVEELAGVAVPPRAAVIRVILSELERLHNHVGDIGNICAGAGLALGNSHGLYLRERLMRLNESLTGHRFLRGCIVPGGVRYDLEIDRLGWALKELEQVVHETQELVQDCLHHDIFRDRMTGTGILTSANVLELGVVGVAARASGISRDARAEMHYGEYSRMPFEMQIEQDGDVRARFLVRSRETAVSLAIIREAASILRPGEIHTQVGVLAAERAGIGVTESARGENVHVVLPDADGTIRRWFVRSASYTNWPAVALAVPGNIVPDFPLINKSFELCYACLDR